MYNEKYPDETYIGKYKNHKNTFKKAKKYRNAYLN